MPSQERNAKDDASQVLARYHDVAVIGAGLIGLSWTALFLANGLRVRVYDPRPGLEDAMRTALDGAAPSLKQLGFATEGLQRRLRIASSLEEAARDASLVQESGPEQIEFKRGCFAQLETFVQPGALLLSSTSSLRATHIAAGMKDPRQMLVGHPFNPPHIMPLVEIVPGEKTAPEAVEEAVRFYRALGKAPVVLHREIDGFVGNRLQAAVLRESIYLVQQGVISVEELDTLVTNSLGLRWSAVGPFQGMHLGGGPGGIAHFLTHLGLVFQKLFDELGEVRLSADTIAQLARQTEQAYGPMPNPSMAGERDRKQLGVLRSNAAVRKSLQSLPEEH
jgi:ketoreductase RED1